MENEKKEIRDIENINDLRLETRDIFVELRTGKIGIREAKELFNGAGKMMNMAKLQLEYNAYTKSKERIPFLEVDKK